MNRNSTYGMSAEQINSNIAAQQDAHNKASELATRYSRVPGFVRDFSESIHNQILAGRPLTQKQAACLDKTYANAKRQGHVG